MAERRPLVLVSGEMQELPSGDTLPGAGGVQNNFAATTAPAVSNDNTEGYAVGSRWVDVTNDNSYTCADASTGAAVWLQENGAGGGGSTTFTGLTDTPANFTSQALKMLRVNAGETALEYVDAPADGKTVLNGTVDPTTEGVDGDFYINTTSNTIFGPKTGGAWGSGTSLVGPAGTNGTNGTDGADGLSAAISIVEETTTARVASNGDLAGAVLVEMNNASAQTYTVNSGLTGTEPVTLIQKGAGAVSVVAGASVTINSLDGNLKLAGQYASATLIPSGTDNYYLVGALIA